MKNRSVWRLLCLSWAAACLSCGSPKMTPEQSHQKMLQTLEQIRQRAAGSDEYFEDASVRLAQRQLAKTNQKDRITRFELHWQLGDDLLRLGENAEAIEHFEAAYELSSQMKDLLSRDQQRQLWMDLAVAHLRRGETENCVHCQTGESCILPIGPGGVHQKTAGSEKAIKYFSLLLEEFPDDLSARWLLNIAYMTLGKYPQEVPPKHLIAPEAFAAKQDFPRFVDVSRERGLKVIDCSGGAAAEDFDGDGDLDLITSNWARDGALRYFRNDGGSFVERSQEAGFDGLYGGLNLEHADYDNDGDMDLLVLRGAWLGTDPGKHPNSLLQNDGQGKFVDVTFAAGLGEEHYPTQTAAWADFDNDGDLDLYVGNEETSSQLFRNNGDGTFEEIAEQAGVLNNRFAKGVSWGDCDNDGDPDLYVSNTRGDNRLYRNNGDVTFTDVAEKLRVAKPRNGFPVWFWDFNNDGMLDLYASSYNVGIRHVAADYLGKAPDEERDCLYQNDHNGGFLEVGLRSGLNRATQPMGCNFGDLDNDGWLDFYLGTGYVDYTGLMPNLMFRNNGGKAFDDVTFAGGFGHLQKGHGTVFADFDQDGDQDVFIQMGGANPGDAFGNVLFENPGFGNHWLTVRLEGTTSNRSAIGARIMAEFVEGEKRRKVFRWVNSGGSFGANPLRQTLGVGKAKRVEKLEIVWPSGKQQVLEDVKAGQFLTIREE